MNPLLACEGLTRRFGGLTAVNRASLDFRLGEVHAVIGTNGAGKSTLVNMLSGEMPASGSSSSSTRGSVARHMAISSCRLPPWLSEPAVRLARSARPAAASASSAIRPLAGQRAALSHSAQGRAWAACALRRQFSKTLNSGKIVVRW